MPTSRLNRPLRTRSIDARFIASRPYPGDARTLAVEGPSGGRVCKACQTFEFELAAPPSVH